MKTKTKNNRKVIKRVKSRALAKRPRQRANAIPVALSPAAHLTRRDQAHLSGTDRILLPKLITNYVAGQIIASVLIEPFITRRLATLSRAYQRIKYSSMRFRVIGQASSLSTGGYICGFLTDPADLLPELKSERGNYLITNTGSQVRSWWTSATVAPKLGNKTFYTNRPQVGADAIREYSPGRFVLICDSQSGQSGYISVELDWTVTLTEATTQDANEVTYITVDDDWFIQPPYLTNSGTPNPIAGTVTTGAAVPVKPSEFADKYGIVLDVGDCVELKQNVPYNMTTASDVSSSILGRFVKRVGDTLMGAAYNSAVQAIQVCDLGWQQKVSPTSPNTYTPYTTPNPNTIAGQVTNAGDQLRIVDVTGQDIVPSVMQYRRRRALAGVDDSAVPGN